MARDRPISLWSISRKPFVWILTMCMEFYPELSIPLYTTLVAKGIAVLLSCEMGHERVSCQLMISPLCVNPVAIVN